MCVSAAVKVAFLCTFTSIRGENPPKCALGKKYFSLSCASGDGSTRAGCLPMLFYEVTEMNARGKRGKVP